MPKGRSFAPATSHDGEWFEQRELDNPGLPQRKTWTSTGRMLNAPFTPHGACYPPPVPPTYMVKNALNFKTSNKFSAHDNRHSFQDHGVYYGNGRDTRQLGKHLVEPGSRQHHTEKYFLKHYGREEVAGTYNSLYSSSYTAAPCDKPPTYRRFPNIHKQDTSCPVKLTTTTTSHFKEPDVPYQTPLHVMAVSQEPFLGLNTWKYSNHGLARCYPPYDRVESGKPYPVWMVQGPQY